MLSQSALGRLRFRATPVGGQWGDCVEIKTTRQCVQGLLEEPSQRVQCQAACGRRLKLPGFWEGAVESRMHARAWGLFTAGFLGHAHRGHSVNDGRISIAREDQQRLGRAAQRGPTLEPSVRLLPLNTVQAFLL